MLLRRKAATTKTEIVKKKIPPSSWQLSFVIFKNNPPSAPVESGTFSVLNFVSSKSSDSPKRCNRADRWVTATFFGCRDVIVIATLAERDSFQQKGAAKFNLRFTIPQKKKEKVGVEHLEFIWTFFWRTCFCRHWEKPTDVAKFYKFILFSSKKQRKNVFEVEIKVSFVSTTPPFLSSFFNNAVTSLILYPCFENYLCLSLFFCPSVFSNFPANYLRHRQRWVRLLWPFKNSNFQAGPRFHQNSFEAILDFFLVFVTNELFRIFSCCCCSGWFFEAQLEDNFFISAAENQHYH